MPHPERVFLDWSKPAATTAAQWLAAGDARAGVDLSDTIAIVPTRQAARRLREALAHAAPGGVLSPQTITPSQLLQPEAGDIAGSAESLIVFLAALAEISARELAHLFPNGIPFRRFEERLHFAKSFFALRESLADAACDLQTAARKLADHPDAMRWSDLARIEHAWLAALRRNNRRERESARLEMAAPVPGEILRIVLVGLADLTPLATRALAALPGSVTIQVLVFAPPELAGAFDDWGRPLAESWQDRAPGWDDFDAQVHLCARGEDTASTLANFLPAATKPDPAYLEIGVLDRGLLPFLRKTLEARGGKLHDPEGESLDRHWLGRLLDDCARFLASPDFTTCCELLRNGPVAGWLHRTVRGFSLAEVLAEADEVRANFFPSTAESAAGKCEPGGSLSRTLDHLLRLRHRMLGRSWLEAARAFFDEVADESARDSALPAVLAALDEIAPLISCHPGIEPPEWLRVARGLLANQRTYIDAEADAIEASGWLELPWSDAPHLVIAGFNQGVVPSRLVQDPFLSPGIRQRLGLPTDEQRAARDAHFLARLLAMRRGNAGRVDVLVCQIDTEGSPGQPSPLLFAGSAGDLPGRVQRLFAEPRPAEADPPWEATWLLDPPRRELKKSLRVTGFRDYLACPFEFYLRFGLKMEAFEPEPAEMDARVFGTLVHDTIEAFSKSADTRDLDDPGEIRDAVSGLLDAYVAAAFESPLSLPLLVQIESARQRLHAFAGAQAAQRRDGWRIVHAEIKFTEYLGNPWLLDGWEITGKIDRIDHHKATDRWRVLDYKTSDNADTPVRAHLRGGTERDWPPDYAFDEASSKWWTNLQLPLYRQLLIEAGRDSGAISCGYFNLPKAVSATGVSEWTNFDESLGASAMRCARGVLADIARERFWPPNPRAPYPQNAGWFHPGPERTVTANSWLRALPA